MPSAQCPEEQLALQNEAAFLADGHFSWTLHRAGLAVAGAATLVTWLISISTILLHLRNFWQPDEQRQICRILTLPMVYSVLMLCAYNWLGVFEYLTLIEAAWEGLALASFLMLLFAYVAKVENGIRHETIASKPRFRAPFPLCCVAYDPYKPAFLAVLKWSVLQYGVIRFLSSIAGCIAQALHVLCADSNSPHFAELWLQVVDFVTITVALFGLLLWADLTRPVLKDGRKRPAAKFITIKLLVGTVFLTSFVVKMLSGAGVLKEGQYWSRTAISHSWIALLTTIEMAFFALLMMWAFSWRDYRQSKPYPMARTPLWRSLRHVLNISDLIREMWLSMALLWAYVRGKAGTRSTSQLDVGAAFHADAESGIKETSGSWQMVEKPASMPAALDGEPREEEEEEPEVGSYRHTLGARTPEVNRMVEILADEHLVGTVQQTEAGRRRQFSGQEQGFSFPPRSNA